MSLRTTKLPAIALAIVVLLAGSVFKDSSRAQVCGREFVCTSGGLYEDCYPSPTSMRPIDIHHAGDFFVDEDNLHGHCGQEDCYLILHCQCGAPLSAVICTSLQKRMY